MGIQNLHKFLERVCTKSNLSNLRGSVVGIDAMCWLHRGCIASAWELLTGRDTDKFLRFFIKMLMLCNACGVKPVVVFDGASIPAKAEEEGQRRERRQSSREKAKEELSARNITSYGEVDNKLRSLIVQAVSISPDMITRTMSVLRRLGVDFIVAPYEADAQLAHMYQQGVISGVVSEDSDLLAFGCYRLISKLDATGDFVDVRLDWAFQGADSPGKPDNLGELGKLEKWTPSQFTDLCILAGSDYKLGKIFGIGIKKAFQLLCKYNSVDRLISVIADSKKWSKDQVAKYIEEYRYSKIAFTFHRVFDLKKFLCVCIGTISTPGFSLPSDEDVRRIVGEAVPPNLVKGVVTGDIDAKNNFQNRVFLDKLPPGVLGAYRASLGPTLENNSINNYSSSISGTQYDLLEKQIVMEFSRMKGEDVKAENKNYLDSLQRMILKTEGKEEFSVWNEDDYLLGLDEGESWLDLTKEDTSDLIDLDEEIGNDTSTQAVPLDAPNFNSTPKRQEVTDTASTTPGAKNPFAKKCSDRMSCGSSAESKKQRINDTVSIVGVSSVLAASNNQESSSLGSTGNSIANYMKRRQSLLDQKPSIPFVSTRNLESANKQKDITKFVRRTFYSG